MQWKRRKNNLDGECLWKHLIKTNKIKILYFTNVILVILYWKLGFGNNLVTFVYFIRLLQQRFWYSLVVIILISNVYLFFKLLNVSPHLINFMNKIISNQVYLKYFDLNEALAIQTLLICVHTVSSKLYVILESELKRFVHLYVVVIVITFVVLFYFVL